MKPNTLIPLINGGVNLFTYTVNDDLNTIKEIILNSIASKVQPIDATLLHLEKPKGVEENRFEPISNMHVTHYATNDVEGNEAEIISLIETLLEEDSCWGMATNYLVMEDIQKDSSILRVIRSLTVEHELTTIIIYPSFTNEVDLGRLMMEVDQCIMVSSKEIEILKRRGDIPLFDTAYPRDE